MNKKFENFTGGMKLSTFALVAVVILAIYTLTSDASGWVQAGSLLAVAVVAILLIRITGIGRSS